MRLSEFIIENLGPILDDWENFAKEIPAAKGMDGKELRDHAKIMLQAIAKDLATPQSEEEQKQKSTGHGQAKEHAEHGESPAEQHASERARSGFSIEDMFAEYRALRASVLRLWSESSDSPLQSALEDMTRFNEAIDQAVAESIARFFSTVQQSQHLFLGILGHDLRNPLGAISMSAQFLMQNSSLDSRFIKAASIIYNSSDQMSHLIDDLLDFTRTRLGQSMPLSLGQTDLLELVQRAITEASAFHPDRTILFDAKGDLRGHWNSARIGQVFSNLLGNAIKHGSDREPINVELSSEDQDVIATVHNGGSPIPEKDLPRIFEPMHQSLESSTSQQRNMGLGLGLYIAQQIVQAHRGTINVTSSIEEGTTFTVRLPRQLAKR